MIEIAKEIFESADRIIAFITSIISLIATIWGFVNNSKIKVIEEKNKEIFTNYERLRKEDCERCNSNFQDRIKNLESRIDIFTKTNI